MGDPVDRSQRISQALAHVRLQSAIPYELHGTDRDLPAADLLNPYSFDPADVRIVLRQPFPCLFGAWRRHLLDVIAHPLILLAAYT